MSFQSIVDAAKANQVGLLRALLKKHSDPSKPNKLLLKKDEDGRTAFHWACSEGQVDIAKFLMEQCGEECVPKLINAQDEVGRTPLMSACSAGKVSVVQLLLGAKANANQRSGKGQMALHYHKGNMAVLELLVPRTTNIDRKDKYGSTALSRAVAGGNAKAVEMLLKAKADPHIVDGAGDTLLHIAASNKDDFMAKLLLSHRVDREVLNKDGKKSRATPWFEITNFRAQASTNAHDFCIQFPFSFG